MGTNQARRIVLAADDNNNKIKTKNQKDIKSGQIWAVFDDSDGFPRRYARINQISENSKTLVQVTPLVPFPVSQEARVFTEKGVTLGCGLFTSDDSTEVKEVSSLSHNVRFEKEGNGSDYYKIFPRKGEVWAMYVNKSEYKLVEAVSDFNEDDGVNVYALEGGNGVYRRQVHQGFYLVRNCSWGFMTMFSHQVPATRVEEGGGIVWRVRLH